MPNLIRIRILVAFATILLGAAGPDVDVVGPQQDVPGRIVATGSFDYTVDVDGHHCTLRYWPNGSEGVLDSSENLGMASLAGCLAPLLDAVLKSHPTLAEIGLTAPGATELLGRLNAALDIEPKWNVHTGAPREGTYGQVIPDIVNRKDLAEEFRSTFERRGFDFKATSARLIMTGPVAGQQGRKLITSISVLEFKATRTARGL